MSGNVSDFFQSETSGPILPPPFVMSTNRRLPLFPLELNLLPSLFPLVKVDLSAPRFDGDLGFSLHNPEHSLDGEYSSAGQRTTSRLVGSTKESSQRESTPPRLVSTKTSSAHRVQTSPPVISVETAVSSRQESKLLEQELALLGDIPMRGGGKQVTTQSANQVVASSEATIVIYRIRVIWICTDGHKLIIIIGC